MDQQLIYQSTRKIIALEEKLNLFIRFCDIFIFQKERKKIQKEQNQKNNTHNNNHNKNNDRGKTMKRLKKKLNCTGLQIGRPPDSLNGYINRIARSCHTLASATFHYKHEFEGAKE